MLRWFSSCNKSGAFIAAYLFLMAILYAYYITTSYNNANDLTKKQLAVQSNESKWSAFIPHAIGSFLQVSLF